GFEIVVLDLRPDAVLVVGDVNSTIACGLVAVKLGVKLIHVESWSSDRLDIRPGQSHCRGESRYKVRKCIGVGCGNK
ncbi:MAG: UDP-N-acetylglucosamine 2-epimerase, partial [Planctomycetes bacterium]|nr:UDP-N-acetylglucosamine 2-epimerase [Planctomycetota bacterium]